VEVLAVGVSGLRFHPAVHTSSAACAVMLPTCGHKAVDQVPGCYSDLGSNAVSLALASDVVSDAP
jgi:hypothetical protein